MAGGQEAGSCPFLAGMHAVFIGHGLFDFTVMGVQVGILFFAGTAVAGGLARTAQNAGREKENQMLAGDPDWGKK